MADRRWKRWTRQEDRELVEFRPTPGGVGVNLRDWAEEHGRSYYAARRRRKTLTAAAANGRARHCPCGAPLPGGRKTGWCDDCRLSAPFPENATNGGRPWTPTHDELLLQAGTDPRVYVVLGRTPTACRVRRSELKRRAARG